MSSFKDLVRLHLTGKPVNVAERSGDAPFILEGEEFNLFWHEATVPVSSLPDPSGYEIYPDKLVQFTGLTPQVLRLITETSPLLFSVDNAECHLLDGAHRLTMLSRAGVKDATVLLGSTQNPHGAADAAYAAAAAAGDLDEGRMLLRDYARARGFVQEWFHGGTATTDFKPDSRGNFLSGTLSHAYTYADQYPTKDSAIVPVMVNPGRILDLTDPAQYEACGLVPTATLTNNPSLALRLPGLGFNDSVISFAKAQGFDSIKFFDSNASNKGSYESLVVFDPARLLVGPNFTNTVDYYDHKLVEGTFRRDSQGALIPLSTLVNEFPGTRDVDAELAEELRSRGEEISNYHDALSRLSNGERLFVFHEMDEEPTEVLSAAMFHGYAVDRMLALPAQEVEQADAPRP
ncbi:hypothetical protein [Polaromonas sp.]|uniref:hypothetical protein n=1 Tax=Polaromonas sp. TaxID=1869339 RepID=UPI00352AB290